MDDQLFFPDDAVISGYVRDLNMTIYFEDSDSSSKDGAEDKRPEDWIDPDIEEEILELEWQLEVKNAPWLFEDFKFQHNYWYPSLSTIFEEDEEEEEDTPSAEEEEEEEDMTVETPRSSSRISWRSIISRLRALFCCGCNTEHQ